MHSPRRTARLAAAVAWFAAQIVPAACAADAAPADAERWFEMRIAGVPAGYVHELTDRADPDALRTSTESLIVLNRLESRVEMEEHVAAVEDRAGHLTGLRARIRASRDTTELELAVAGEELAITTTAGGRSYHRSVHETRVLLGPDGIRALTAAQLAAGAESLHYATFVPELGAVAEATRRVTGRAPGAAGQPQRYVLEETLDVMPTPSRLLVEADGRLVEESMAGPFGDLQVVAATAAVRDGVARAGQLPEELYARTLLRANVRLPEPRSIDRLRVRIDLKRPAAGFPELEGPYQHVLERAADHVVLEIERAPAIEGSRRVAAADAGYTRPNFILQSDHPDVAALARALRVPGAGPYAQARLLQDWVAEHMRFDAGLTMLPASEVVRDRGGTCVAYAVLLTSLARALGIPARVVMGYVYLDGIWGGHAWTEVKVGGRWIPLDAAVYRPGPADAAHIAIVRHSAEQGAGSGAAELARLFGNESIRIVGFHGDGRWIDVPPDAAPYTIDGDHYRNPWLGLALDKPAALAFTKADASYPDATVIALAAPGGDEIRLLQTGARTTRVDARGWLAAQGYQPDDAATRVAGRPAVRGRAPSRAALAFKDGLDLWVLEAHGEQAVQALDGVAAQLTLRPRRASPAATP